MIYLDHNATTPLHPRVAQLLQERYAQPLTGNASSVHAAGRAARRRLEDARAQVARALGVEPAEIVFTATGSEADALAIKGAWAARKDPSRDRVVTSTIEHPAVLGAVEQLAQEGAEVIRIAPGRDGVVPAEALEDALTDRTALCSLMWANNETGVLQPVREVARLCRARGIAVHSDAVQAIGKVPVSMREADVDLLALSAHKFGGPTGVGALVVRRGVTLRALTSGHHENGRRGGTASVAHAEALALALELAAAELEENAARMRGLRDGLERELCARLPGVRINGAQAPRTPNTASVAFEGIDSETLLMALDLEGVCASSGAACASGALSASHVLLGMGLTPKEARATLRLSVGRTTTAEEIDEAVALIVRSVERARASLA